MDRSNFRWLLVALLILLFGLPIADDLMISSRPLIRALVMSGLLAIGIWSLQGSGRLFGIAMTLVVIGIVLNVLSINSPSRALTYGTFTALFGFLLIAIYWTLRQVAVGSDINTNRLIGAICVYLLLGVLWAIAYMILELLTPGSFHGISATDSEGWNSQWLYFSFVTMTTLGYGDISPTSATTQAFAYMQAVAGQFYIAILVAGLVSAYITRRRQDRDS